MLLLLVLLAFTTGAQESSPPKSARITFLPPPLEGTISLGIYDAGGKLVRVLFREAELEDFEAGSDALTAVWDGKDDAGQQLPPGKYHARGYAVGEVNVEGEGFYFNDWVSDAETPRVRRISRLWFHDHRLIINAAISDGEGAGTPFWCDRGGKIVALYQGFLGTGEYAGVELPKTTGLVAWCFGKDETIWLIDRPDPGSAQTVVKQFSKENEFIRQLTIEAKAPQPVSIAASTEDDRIFLLEQNEAIQRVRALTLLESKEEGGHAVSNWKIDFERKIVAHKNFGIENGKPAAAGGKALAEKITVRLQANALKNERRETVELFIGYDDKGSFLRTADGLPLQSISDTPHLIRAGFVVRGDNSADVFQDDDAVVEQYRITGLDQMMAFDCGEIELK